MRTRHLSVADTLVPCNCYYGLVVAYYTGGAFSRYLYNYVISVTKRKFKFVIMKVVTEQNLKLS